MERGDLEVYCQKAVSRGAQEARVSHPGMVVTAPWVRYKCRFGCPSYGKSFSCPPDTPDHRETRELLDSYKRGILVHYLIRQEEGRKRLDVWRKMGREMVELEGEMFKDGFYKAFALLAGHCQLCKECAKVKGEPCNFGGKARPSMEACGIDVYQTARNNGFFIQPLREKHEDQNVYCLMLVD